MQWIKDTLRPDPDFRCARCPGTARPIGGRTVKEMQVNDEKLNKKKKYANTRIGSNQNPNPAHK